MLNVGLVGIPKFDLFFSQLFSLGLGVILDNNEHTVSLDFHEALAKMLGLLACCHVAPSLEGQVGSMEGLHEPYFLAEEAGCRNVGEQVLVQVGTEGSGLAFSRHLDFGGGSQLPGFRVPFTHQYMEVLTLVELRIVLKEIGRLLDMHVELFAIVHE